MEDISDFAIHLMSSPRWVEKRIAEQKEYLEMHDRRRPRSNSRHKIMDDDRWRELRDCAIDRLQWFEALLKHLTKNATTHTEDVH